MSWIKTVAYADAGGRLRKLYDRVKGPDDNVDNIMMAHSLRPHSMEGHMALYKYVLHHSSNTVPKWFLEVIGVWVSLLNACAYCAEHHFAGLVRLEPPVDTDALYAALAARDLAATGLGEKYVAALEYAETLTVRPAEMVEGDVAALRQAGFDDGEILEINQVTAYFSYANRTVLGLGVSTDGDVLGLSPGNSADADDWSHS